VKLSRDRAAAVVGALAAAGIPLKRLRSTGFGAAAPIADHDTPEGRAQNRRVELVKM
jgi:OmpA-OmpF porin, OOP family